MNKVILMLFSTSLFLLFYQFQKDKKSDPNNLEQIMKLLPNPEKYFKHDEVVYLISHPANHEIFNKTQFALAPIRLSRAKKDLPHISSVLVVKDLNAGGETEQADLNGKEIDTVFTAIDSHFFIAILKIK